jgi:hypothetical protein
MSDYRLIDVQGAILRIVDSTSIPNDPANRDRADYDAWLAAGGVPDPYVAPPPPPVTVLSQDMMGQFTADDAEKIQAAVSANPQFWLLWSALQAQKDPMEVSNARFLAGWSALVTVLGADRMAAIAAALGIKVA